MRFLCNLALSPRHTKEVACIFKTLVCPQIKYAAPTCIWHPYHKTQIQLVEKVLRTAARWPAGDGEAQEVSETCWTNLSGHPWRLAGSSPP